MASKTCVNCGKELGALAGKVDVSDGTVCMKCLNSVGIHRLESPASYTASQIRSLIASRGSFVPVFSPTKKIGSYLQIDDIHRTFKVDNSIFEYSNLLGFEMLEDGETITKGGLGRAVVGGLLFGGVGAIVGGVTGGKKAKNSCTSMRIKLTFRDTYRSTAYITFIQAKTPTKGFIYQASRSNAQECLSALQIIIDQYQSEKEASAVQQSHTSAENQSNISVADEILKFKQLMDVGVITEAEFESKKKQLLGL